jgi:hypothetical protein
MKEGKTNKEVKKEIMSHWNYYCPGQKMLSAQILAVFKHF